MVRLVAWFIKSYSRRGPLFHRQNHIVTIRVTIRIKIRIRPCFRIRTETTEKREGTEILIQKGKGQKFTSPRFSE